MYSCIFNGLQPGCEKFNKNENVFAKGTADLHSTLLVITSYLLC